MERDNLHRYGESVAERWKNFNKPFKAILTIVNRKERIGQIQRELRKLAKEQKKAARRKMEEKRLREEEERRKKHILSKDELALIQKTLKGRENEVVISAYNTDLKKSDVRHLRDTEWLNDEVGEDE